jgi:hypothetical protein
MWGPGIKNSLDPGTVMVRKGAIKPRSIRNMQQKGNDGLLKGPNIATKGSSRRGIARACSDLSKWRLILLQAHNALKRNG